MTLYSTTNRSLPSIQSLRRAFAYLAYWFWLLIGVLAISIIVYVVLLCTYVVTL